MRVAIVGASGYTGAELIRLLLHHPHVELVGLYARRNVDVGIDDVFPHLRGICDLPVAAFDADRVSESADAVFCALPHGQSATTVAALRARDRKVVDLSADFRLRNLDTYATWYGSAAMPQHPAPELIGEAVYGLPERHREAIAAAPLVAGPGCYPTAAILPAAPLLEKGLIQAKGLIVDAKSGVTGAGRTASPATHFSEIGEGVRAYKVAGQHRHTVEIEQELGICAGGEIKLTFTPQLLPMARGILACVYAAPTDAARGAAACRQALLDAYANEPFVSVLPAGQLPDTSHVRGSNRAQVAVVYDERAERVLALSAIDNLVKGASGQAVQCLNLMYGWPEDSGLTGMPMFP